MDNSAHIECDDHLILRSFTDELSEDELLELQQKLETDFLFKKHYEEMKTVWYFTSLSVADKEKDWANIKKHIANTNKISMWGYFVRIAAIFILFLSVSTGVWLYWNVPGYGRWEVFETTNSSDSIVLPDNSVVYLNRNSSLKYLKSFDKNKRLVSLKGEGYFEVSHNEASSFSVNIANISVKVLGTSFNLYDNKKEGVVELNVVDGAVLLSNKNKSEVIKKGESIYADKYNLQKQSKTDLNFLSWKTGILEYSEASLVDILNSLESYYDEIVSYENSLNSDILVTTKFCNSSIDEVLDELEIHFQKKFSLNNGKLIITD